MSSKEYIEREAAIAAAFSATSLGNSAFRDVYDTVNRLRLIPSADVAPVRYGRWVKKHDDVYCWHECSVCGTRPPKDQWKQIWLSAYCPDCGALMDGGET